MDCAASFLMASLHRFMDSSNAKSGEKMRELNRGESAAQYLRRARMLDDLMRANGPPLATRELARMMGVS